MKTIVSAIAAAALCSCGPDLDEESPATTANALIDPGLPRHEQPSKVEWTPAPKDAVAVDPVATFQQHFAYTVCSLGVCR